LCFGICFFVFFLSHACVRQDLFFEFWRLVLWILLFTIFLTFCLKFSQSFAVKHYTRSMKKTFTFLMLAASFCAQAQTADTLAAAPSVPKDSMVKRLPQPVVSIFPNPVQSRCELGLKHFDAGMAQVQVRDAGGTVVYSEKRLLAGSPDRVVLFLRAAAGWYVCTVTQGRKQARVRFLKME
jgi:hypothetical protein